MKKAILILLTVFLAVSCSQVVYDNLPPADISVDNVSFLVERVRAGNDDTLKLKFTPVAYVSKYGYQVDNNSVVDINPNNLGYEDEYITYQLPVNEEYSETGLVKLFSRSDSGDAFIKAAEYSFLTTSDVAPNVTVRSRYENYVELYVSANDPEIEYQVTVTDKTETKEPVVMSSLKAENGIITVIGLFPDHEYTLIVAHKSAGDEDYGQNTTSLDVGKYEYSVVISLEVTDTAFTASEIPEGINSVSLRKISDNEEKYKEIVSADVNNGAAMFSFSDMKSLESGIFYVYAEDASGKYISNTVSETTPIIVKGRTENYRSVDLYIDFADDVKEDETVTFAVSGLTGVSASIQDFKSNDGHDVLTISGIDSNTTYDKISFSANKVGAFAVSSVVENVTTKSFAGKFFEWNGDLVKVGFLGENRPNTNFIIYVDNKKEGSDYPYYVYFSENDAAIDVSSEYKASDFRIMPLLDSSDKLNNPDPKTDANNKVICESNTTSNGENVTSQNKTYTVNSQKWNALTGTGMESLAKITEWYIETPDANSSKDIVTTETMSKAAILSKFAPTETTFSFGEYRNENNLCLPYVKFKNYSDNGTVKSGLYTNGNKLNTPESFGDNDADPSYCWYLTLVDLSEGGAK